MRKIHKAWLIGADTAIGKSILKQVDARVINIIATDMEDVNISDIDEALAYSYLNQPDAIINCYDFSDRNECEKNPVKAYKLNSIVPRNLAICSRKIGARFLHISADTVFGVEKDLPYNEFDFPNPMDVYSNSKLQGENFVRELSQKYFIVRTGYVYERENGVLNKPYENNRLINPTSSDTLADFIIKLINTPEYGVYHAGSTGYCTYDSFIKKYNELTGDILKQTENSDLSYKDIKLEQFMLKLSNIYSFPTWEKDLQNYIEQLN